MNNYHLFSGNEYYPNGGVNDCVGSYETLDEAKLAHAKIDPNNWAHIAYVVDNKLVKVTEWEPPVRPKWTEPELPGYWIELT